MYKSELVYNIHLISYILQEPVQICRGAASRVAGAFDVRTAR